METRRVETEVGESSQIWLQKRKCIEIKNEKLSMIFFLKLYDSSTNDKKCLTYELYLI